MRLRDPDYILDSSAESFGQFLAGTLTGIEDILCAERPDAFLVLGDTNSALSAIIAKKMRIPVYHLEAGNRSFDSNVPEETNRRILDHLADFNFPYSEAGRRNLLAEGLEPRRILLSGSPMFEVLRHYNTEIKTSNSLRTLNLDPQRYFVVSVHRQETVDNPKRLAAMLDTLTAVHDTYGLPLLVSTHPRTRDRLSEGIGYNFESTSVIFHEPFGFIDYVHLQRHAYCVLSDSGTLSEEAAILQFPAVTLRNAIERPEALEAGVVSLADVSPDRALEVIEWAVRGSPNRYTPPEYKVPNFSERILNAILSTAPSHVSWSGLHPL